MRIQNLEIALLIGLRLRINVLIVVFQLMVSSDNLICKEVLDKDVLCLPYYL